MIFSLTLLLASDALANPIAEAVIDDARCDKVSLPLTEELGRGASNPYGPPGPFPIGEEIRLQTVSWAGTACGISGSGLRVIMTNLSANRYQDLVFVAPNGVSVLNADGYIYLGNRPHDAFLIDVADVNRPLLYESMSADGLFQPGEVWEFVVASPTYSSILSSVGPGLGGNTLGVGAADLPPFPYHGNPDFSILANLALPEPQALLLLASGLAGVGMRSRRR